MWIQFERSHDAVLTILQSQSVCGPRTLLLDFLIGAPWCELGQYAFFHHLSDGSIAEYHDRCSPLEHQFLGQSHHVCHFLYIAGSQYDDMIITIATSVYSLKVIRLGGLYGAQTRASSLYRHDESGYFACSHVGYAFLHECYTWAGGRGEHTFSRCSTCINHIDGGKFRFALEYHHSCCLPGLLYGQSL